MHMFGIRYISCFAILFVFDLTAGLATLPKVAENDIAKAESVIRKTTNAIFCSLKLKNIRNRTSIKQFSLIHNYFVSLTLQDYSSLKEIAKLTRVVKPDIENVTTNFITLINEILDDENVIKLESILMDEDIGPRYDIESEIEKLMNLKKMHVDNKNKIMEINKDVIKILQDDTNLDLNVSTTLESPIDYSNENILDENIFWHETDRPISGRRIFDGQRTKIKHYPFMASIQIFNKFQCAGCIIKSDLVITAASCLQLAWNNRFYRENPPFLSVRVGSSFYEFGGEKIGVQEVYFHPEYNPKNLRNNLALVRLERKIELNRKNKKVKKIHVDKFDHKLSSTAGMIEILGWGATSYSNKLHGAFDDKLKHAVLHIYPHNECQELYSKEFVTKNNFCGGYISKGTGACNRDIGGPGLVSGILTGIISFGAPSCGTPDAPTVFTKLGFYYDWIEEIMEQDVPVYKKKTTLKPKGAWHFPLPDTGSTNWYLPPPSTKGLLRHLRSKTNETKLTANDINKNMIESTDKDLFQDYLKTVFESDEGIDYLEIEMLNTTSMSTTQVKSFLNYLVSHNQTTENNLPQPLLLTIENSPTITPIYDSYNALENYATPKSQTFINVQTDTPAYKVLPVEEIQNQIHQLDNVVAQEKENREKYIEHELQQIIENTNIDKDKINIRTEMFTDNPKSMYNDNKQKNKYEELSNHIKQLIQDSELQDNEKYRLIMESLTTTKKQMDNYETLQDKFMQEKQSQYSFTRLFKHMDIHDQDIFEQEKKKISILHALTNIKLNDTEKYDHIMKIVILQDRVPYEKDQDKKMQHNVMYQKIQQIIPNLLQNDDTQFETIQTSIKDSFDDSAKQTENYREEIPRQNILRIAKDESKAGEQNMPPSYLANIMQVLTDKKLQNKEKYESIMQQLTDSVYPIAYGNVQNKGVFVDEINKQKQNNIPQIGTDTNLKDKEKYDLIMQILTMPNEQNKLNKIEQENDVTQVLMDLKAQSREKSAIPIEIANLIQRNVDESLQLKLRDKENVNGYINNYLNIEPIIKIIEEKQKVPFNNDYDTKISTLEDPITAKISANLLLNDQNQVLRADAQDKLDTENLKNKIRQLAKLAIEEEKYTMQSEAQKVKDESPSTFEGFSVQTNPIEYNDMDSVKDNNSLKRDEKELYQYILQVSNDPNLEDSQKEDSILLLLNLKKTDILAKQTQEKTRNETVEEGFKNSANSPNLEEQQRYYRVMNLIDDKDQYFSTLTLPPIFSTLSSFSELMNTKSETDLRNDVLKLLSNEPVNEKTENQTVTDTLITRERNSPLEQYSPETFLNEPTQSKLDNMLAYILSINPKIGNNNTQLYNMQTSQNDLSAWSVKPTQFVQKDISIHSFTTRLQETSIDGIANEQGNFGAASKKSTALSKNPLLEKYSQTTAEIPDFLQNGYKSPSDSLSPLKTGFIFDTNSQQISGPLKENVADNLKLSIFDKISQSLAESPKYVLDKSQAQLFKPESTEILTPEISKIANNFKEIKNNLETVFTLLKLKKNNMTADGINSIYKLRDTSTTNINSDLILNEPIFRSSDQSYKSNIYQKTRDRSHPQTTKNAVMDLYGKLLKDKDVYYYKIRKIVASVLRDNEAKEKTYMESYKKLLQNDDASRNKITQILLSLMSEKKKEGEQDSSIIEIYSNIIKNDDFIKNKIAQILTSVLSDNNDNWKNPLRVESSTDHPAIKENHLNNIDNTNGKKNITTILTKLYTSITPSSMLYKPSKLADVDLRILKILNDPDLLKQETVNTLPYQVQKVIKTAILPGKHHISTTKSSYKTMKIHKTFHNTTTQVLPMTTHQPKDLIQTGKSNYNRYKEMYFSRLGTKNKLNLSILPHLRLTSPKSYLKVKGDKLHPANQLSSTPEQFDENIIHVTVLEKGLLPSAELLSSHPTHRKGTFQNIADQFYGVISNSVNQLTSAIGLNNKHHTNNYNSSIINPENKQRKVATTNQHNKVKNKGILRYISDRLFGVPDGPEEENATTKTVNIPKETKTTNSAEWLNTTKEIKRSSKHTPVEIVNKDHENKLLSFTSSPLRQNKQEKDLKNIADQVFKILGNPEANEEKKREALLLFASVVESTDKKKALRFGSITDLEQENLNFAQNIDNNEEDSNLLKLDTDITESYKDQISEQNDSKETQTMYLPETTTIATYDNNLKLENTSKLDFDTLNQEIDQTLQEWKMQHKEI